MKFWKIIKVSAAPLVILGMCLYFLFGFKTYNRLDLIDGMIIANQSGILDGEKFTNDAIGLSFDTPQVEDIPWHIIKYRDQFTQSPTLNQCTKAEFAAMEKNNYWPYFVLRARFMDIPHSVFRRETSQEFGKRMRDDYVRKTSSYYREEYFNRFIISDSEPVIINGYTYYKYASYDIETGDYFQSYVIRMNSFGYRFMFYGWGEQIDRHFVDEIMYSIEFTKPTIKFELNPKNSKSSQR